MLNKIALTALILIAIAFILIVVGVATDGWVFILGRNVGFSLSFGASSNIIDEERPKGQAAYALCILATLGAAAALTTIAILTIMQHLGKASDKMAIVLSLVSKYAAVFGSICGVIGSIIQVVWFTKSFTFESYSPGYSFFLTIIGSVILSVGAGFASKAKVQL